MTILHYVTKGAFEDVVKIPEDWLASSKGRSPWGRPT